MSKSHTGPPITGNMGGLDDLTNAMRRGAGMSLEAGAQRLLSK
jgi:hypothetical protein